MSKVILITGASRGIGRSAALIADARDWSVGVNYASNAAASAPSRSKATSATKPRPSRCSTPPKRPSASSTTWSTTRASSLADMDIARMKRIFGINVLGAFLCARSGAPPVDRADTADEVGKSIVWLLSDASSYMTGALLDVTGDH